MLIKEKQPKIDPCEELANLATEHTKNCNKCKGNTRALAEYLLEQIND